VPRPGLCSVYSVLREWDRTPAMLSIGRPFSYLWWGSRAHSYV